MPGLLKKDANCPECGENLIALVDTTNSKEVVREFIHGPNKKGKRKCTVRFDNHELAHFERQQLEVQL